MRNPFFFEILLDFTPYWDHKPTNAINAYSAVVYTSEKIFNLGTRDEIHLKCDIFAGSVVKCSRQPIRNSFVFDKKSGYKIFREPETKHYSKLNRSVLNTVTFYLEDGDQE